uniref:Protein kinase domain-containing protein n=1 Tax=Physcomitrium patens TaxID=3218 RepID=A0A2K1KBR6_PHYPA|nr:hypothetical protein PHYPA_010399 [Physcomitrium patens]
MADDGRFSSVSVERKPASAMAWDPKPSESHFQIFLALFVFFILGPLPSASAATALSDVTALHELREAWNATLGLAQNWTWGSDPCWNHWEGVSCFEETVVSLRLDVRGLVGAFSPSIGKLKNLQYLNLANNPGLTGPISEEIGQLSRLYALDLSHNNFGGPFPEFLLKLPVIKRLNLSFNQLTGVLDGGVRTFGHVNIFLIKNNISAVVNLPSPFINPELRGNPVCEDQSSHFPDICSYSGIIPKEILWQQKMSCSTVCDQNSVVHPGTCACYYPYICNMYFGWSPSYGFDETRIDNLRRALASGLKISFENLWIENATYWNISERQLLAKVIFYPASPSRLWDRSQVNDIKSKLIGKTIRLEGYDPYGLIASTLQTAPSNTGIFDLDLEHYPSCLFLYDELRVSTRNFNRGNKIGEGTFGAVYKGTMVDGSEVAVKELPPNIKQGNQEFLNEVQLISGLQHKNLVKLRGCAISGKNRLLAFEYVENRSLHQALFDPVKALLLEWPIRYNIALGMAKGLACLHSQSPERLAHGDIKANNILLDRHLEPKIADFGLARMCQNNERRVVVHIEGKRGYIAPEYALHGQLTPMTDVFSFGIVALELVSGRQRMNPELPAEEQYLLSYVWNLHEQRRLMDLVDPKIRNECDEEQALVLIKVALLCSQGEASSRPEMAQVVSLLSGDAGVPDVLHRPVFLGLGVIDPNKLRPRPSSLTTWR